MIYLSDIRKLIVELNQKDEDSNRVADFFTSGQFPHGFQY